MKKYLVSILVLVAMLGIVGCGGGSSSDNSDKNQEDKEEIKQPDNTGATTLPKVDGKTVFTKRYLSGKTLYLVSSDNKDVISFVFDESSFSSETVYRKVASLGYDVTDEGYMSFTELDSGKKAYFKPLSQDSNKISIVFSYDKASLANITKANKYFYFVKEKAVEYIKNLNTGDTTNNKGFKFTKEYLSGKTFYEVVQICESYEGRECVGWKWRQETLNFTNTKVIGAHGDNDYSITSDGSILLHDDTENDIVKPIEKTADYISVISEYEGSPELNKNTPNAYLFFEKAKADTFLDKKSK